MNASEILLGHQGDLSSKMRQEMKKRGAAQGDSDTQTKRSKPNSTAGPLLPPPSPTAATTTTAKEPDAGHANFDDFMDEIDNVGDTDELPSSTPNAPASSSTSKDSDAPRIDPTLSDASVTQNRDFDQAAYEAKLGHLYSLASSTQKVETVEPDVDERLYDGEVEGEEELDLVSIMKKKKKEEKRRKKEMKKKREDSEDQDQWRRK